MSLKFDKNNFDSISLIPENLQSLEIYPKLQEMMNYIVRNYAEEFEDIQYKYRGPGIVREEVIKEIIKELGYEYIAEVMDTISNYEFNTLLDFISLVSLLKGSRQGLELTLRLLGFESFINEWWEMNPKGTPYTFEIVIIAQQTFINDIFDTIDKVKIFSRAYVFPTIDNVDFRFSFDYGSVSALFVGFHKTTVQGLILGRIP